LIVSGFLDLAARPLTDLLGAGEPDAELIEVVDVDVEQRYSSIR
jgi:hypothetical protein